jgi:hypothetical protein
MGTLVKLPACCERLRRDRLYPAEEARMRSELLPIELQWEEGARQINECEYLFIDSVRELEELTLELIVTEAKLQAQILVPRDEGPIEQLRSGGQPIERDLTCRSFQVIFDRRHMVSYTVLDESYGTYPESPEQFDGKLFRVFSCSHLLDFTKKHTCASDEYPGLLQHYEIVCLNHVVDVICTGPPSIAIRSI